MFQITISANTPAELNLAVLDWLKLNTAGAELPANSPAVTEQTAEKAAPQTTTGRRASRAAAPKNDPAPETTTETTAPATTTGRRTRGAAAKPDKLVNDNAEQAAVRAKIEEIGLDFAEYPDLVVWVNDELKRLGCTLIQDIPTAELEKVHVAWEAKAAAEFAAS